MPIGGREPAVVAYFEWKNELGSSGDPGIQVGLTYRKRVVQGVVRLIPRLRWLLLIFYCSGTKAFGTPAVVRVCCSPSQVRTFASWAPSSCKKLSCSR